MIDKSYCNTDALLDHCPPPSRTHTFVISNSAGVQNMTVVRADFLLDDDAYYVSRRPGCESEWTCPGGHACSNSSTSMVMHGVLCALRPS